MPFKEIGPWTIAVHAAACLLFALSAFLSWGALKVSAGGAMDLYRWLTWDHHS